MEEKLAVSDLICYLLERLWLALSLILEDAETFDVGVSASVEAVCSNHVTLRITLVQGRDLDSHATVNVLDGVHGVLTIEGGQ